MLFLQTRVHSSLLDRIIGEEQDRTGELPAMAFAVCPRCELAYLSLPIAGGPWLDLMDEELAAEDVLERECPDHPHRFTMDP